MTSIVVNTRVDIAPKQWHLQWRAQIDGKSNRQSLSVSWEVLVEDEDAAKVSAQRVAICVQNNVSNIAMHFRKFRSSDFGQLKDNRYIVESVSAHASVAADVGSACVAADVGSAWSNGPKKGQLRCRRQCRQETAK